MDDWIVYCTTREKMIMPRSLIGAMVNIVLN